uniref:Uncharacterized protein n=1 Tax=Anguilla anguilla TaxID=7936 RepID=A0A0E9SAD6_ANGAN
MLNVIVFPQQSRKQKHFLIISACYNTV